MAVSSGQSVLSTVYRIWAGFRPQDAMKWQERWIHKDAYGFRSKRGAMDAASVLQVLLEATRAVKSTVAGYGLDYNKCYDLVPHAVARQRRKGCMLGPSGQPGECTPT